MGREGTYIYLWPIHIWQKLAQYCKAIILQLEIKIFLKSSQSGKKFIFFSCKSRVDRAGLEWLVSDTIHPLPCQLIVGFHFSHRSSHGLWTSSIPCAFQGEERAKQPPCLSACPIQSLRKPLSALKSHSSILVSQPHHTTGTHGMSLVGPDEVGICRFVGIE